MGGKPILAVGNAGWMEVVPASAAGAVLQDPRALLEGWRRFEHLLDPVSRDALERAAVGLEPRVLEEDDLVEHEPMPGIRVLALRTPTLPPARHTNAYVIGEEKLIIVDPATYEADEREKLLDRLERRLDRGATIEAIVLTHHHTDHVGAAQWLADKTKAEIAAHPVTRDLLNRTVKITRTLDEGEVLELGGGFRLGVHFTPGHAPGHLILRDLRPGARAMIVGDMIAGIGTIIVDPPEGDMAVYIEQLRRMRAMPNAVLFPAHGAPQIDGHAKLDQYVAHRLDRENKVFAALQQKSSEATPYDLLSEAYADTSPMLYALAARSCLAHLLKLAKDGRAVQRGEHFRAL